jgi:hypothetical protein
MERLYETPVTTCHSVTASHRGDMYLTGRQRRANGPVQP